MDKQKRRGNFSLEEVQVLSTFVRLNTKDLFGKGEHPGLKVKERKNSAWDRGVEALKAHGVAPSRTGADLRLAWNEMAYRARKYNDRRNQTGGGPKPPVNMKFELVLEALNDVCVNGFADISSETGVASKATGEGSRDKAATSILSTMMEGDEIEVERVEEEEENVEEEEGVEIEQEVPYQVKRKYVKRVPEPTFHDKLLAMEERKVVALNDINATLKLILAKCPNGFVQ